jgi:hypothetical protein
MTAPTAPPPTPPPTSPPPAVLPALTRPKKPGRWPGPARTPSRRAVAALVAGAAIGATSLPLDRPGIGWLGAVLAGAGTLGAANRPRDFGRCLWCLATIALLGVGTIRAAGWLFALCVLAAGVTACLALVDARSVGAMVVAVVLPPAAAVRSLPWVRKALHGRRAFSGRALATAAASAGLLLVFGALFASADAAFADLADRVLPSLDGSSVARWVVLFPGLAVALAGAAYLRAAPPNLAGLDAPAARRLRATEWAVPAALLDALFLAFVLVQVTVLFGGRAHVLHPDGPTYAQYARGGFWQLLAVTALTLLVIAAAARWAPRATRADRVLIRVLLGTLAALTLVIVASALHRMNVYEQAYGYTRLRVFVSAVELALGAVFLLVLAAGVRLRGAWLPRAVVAVAVVALLGLAALDPDRFVADRNVDRFAATGRIDLHYLNRLSADAVPALDRLSGDDRACALGLAELRLTEDRDDWRAFNVARERARDLLAERPAGVCTSYR